VLVGPGYPEPGNTNPARMPSDQIGVTTLRSEGYNAVTWDPRGLGGSGGTVMFDSPDFEARDVQAIVDWLAAQPEALLDASGDPRVGMSGSSYGGAIQLVSAAIEPRIDAIVPDAAWHSLQTSFFKDGAVKLGWFAGVCGTGLVKGLLDGLLFGPAGVQLGAVDATIVRACLEGLAGGSASAATRRWFADRGPAWLLSRIRAPTLLTQGTVDVLFPLSEAIANHAALRANGVPLKMIWHCGGHGPCMTGTTGDRAHVAHAGLAWLARWLKRDATVDTGAPFEWVADDGVVRSAAGFPLAPAGSVDAEGSGSLLLTPVSGLLSGRLISATPASVAVNVDFPLPPRGSDLVGAPTVKLTYRGTAVPARTFLYAQIVSTAANRVLGGQVTPIPVVLDGRERTVERPLEVIAAHSYGDAGYRLQILAGTLVYSVQRSIGSVRLSRVAGSLPLGDPAATRGVAQAVLRRRPRRPRIALSSERAGRFSRVVLRGRLGTRPCSGTVTFTIRTGRDARTRRARVTRGCAARATAWLRVPPGTRARVSARFDGNEMLAPRPARSLLRRLR
jgi:ABC-2 type transport system ATP-binding protein